MKCRAACIFWTSPTDQHSWSSMKWPMLTVLMFHLCVAELLLGPEPGPAPTPDLDSELIPYKHNPAPCMRTYDEDKNERFNKQHLCNLNEYGSDPARWTKHIQDICNKRKGTKSFLDESEQLKVEEVCSPSGGKLYKEHKNLCISKKNFSYVEVRWNENCIAENVENKTQHIILACDEIDNQCLPVHFEKNPEKHQPNNNLPACGGRSSEEEGWVEVEGNDE